jgi:hypothetical protein
MGDLRRSDLPLPRRLHYGSQPLRTGGVAIAAQRVVRYLERAGFVVLKKPPLAGYSALGRAREG